MSKQGKKKSRSKVLNKEFYRETERMHRETELKKREVLPGGPKGIGNPYSERLLGKSSAFCGSPWDRKPEVKV